MTQFSNVLVHTCCKANWSAVESFTELASKLLYYPQNMIQRGEEIWAAISCRTRSIQSPFGVIDLKAEQECSLFRAGIVFPSKVPSTWKLFHYWHHLLECTSFTGISCPHSSKKSFWKRNLRSIETTPRFCDSVSNFRMFSPETICAVSLIWCHTLKDRE